MIICNKGSQLPVTKLVLNRLIIETLNIPENIRNSIDQ